MTAFAESRDLWGEDERRRPEREADGLIVDVAGFEGPLDLLLVLARSQKVDLAKISILALAEQYLAFIEGLGARRLELAAEYLVMAAWLAFLKSRLLLPEPPAPDEPTGEELAEALAWRLRRLEAFREAAARLANRSRLGRDVFARGAPEPIEVETTTVYAASLYELLSAYAAHRRRREVVVHRIGRRRVWSLAEARAMLTAMIGEIAAWTPLDVFLAPHLAEPEMRRTAIASTLGAGLELVREGRLAMRQSAPFAPIELRDQAAPRATEVTAGG